MNGVWIPEIKVVHFLLISNDHNHGTLSKWWYVIGVIEIQINWVNFHAVQYSMNVWMFDERYLRITMWDNDWISNNLGASWFFIWWYMRCLIKSQLLYCTLKWDTHMLVKFSAGDNIQVQLWTTVYKTQTQTMVEVANICICIMYILQIQNKTYEITHGIRN